MYFRLLFINEYFKLIEILSMRILASFDRAANVYWPGYCPDYS